MAWDITGNFGSAIVTSGGTDAPASGTVETFVVSNPVGIPSISASVTQFRLVDANMASNPNLAEIMVVTNVVGASWTVTRGAEAIGGNATTPVAHSGGWTAIVVTTNLGIANAAQNQSLNVNSASVGASVIVPAPNVVPYYNANYYTLTQTGASLQLPAPYVGLDTQVGVYQGASGGFAYSFTDPTGDVVPQGSPGVVPYQFDNYQVRSTDGLNLDVHMVKSCLRAAPVAPGPSFTAAASGFQYFSPSVGASPTLSLVTSAASNFIVIAVTTFSAQHVNALSCSNLNGAGLTVLVPNFTGAFSENDWMAMVPVTGAGTATLTIGLAGSPSSSIHVAVREFSTTLGSLSQDGSSATSTSALTSFNGPSLTPAGAGELYICMMRSSNADAFASGGTTGYTADATNDILGFIWNPNCTSSAQSPAMTQGSAQTWQMAAALIK